ncbi:hypothetical protein MRX96_049037 [Rhipicephalus microplus]
MTAETKKNAQGNMDHVADIEEVGDEVAPEDEEGYADEGAENANGEKFIEVEKKIVEKEAEEFPEWRRRSRTVTALQRGGQEAWW